MCAVVPTTIVAAAQRYASRDNVNVPALMSATGVMSTAAAASTPSMNANGSIAYRLRSTRPYRYQPALRNRLSTAISSPARLHVPLPDDDVATKIVPATATPAYTRVSPLDVFTEEQHRDDDDDDGLERADQRDVEQARLVDRNERAPGGGREEGTRPEHEQHPSRHARRLRLAT